VARIVAAELPTPVLRAHGRLCGFLRCVQAEPGILNLSEIYLDASVRHSGLGQLLLGRARSIADGLGCTAIVLHVNRHNDTAVAAYRRAGFVVTAESRIDIGGGFFMDDYGLDLRWFEDARIAGLQTLSQMAERCAGLCRSLDVPNLYFPAVGLDAAGATSWVFVMIARTILSDIRGTAHWPAEPLGRKLNHLEIARHLAEIDPASFPPGRGWEEIRQLALSLPDDQPYPMP